MRRVIGRHYSAHLTIRVCSVQREVAGRVLLLGLLRRMNASEALMLYDPGEGDPTFAIACRMGSAGEPEIAWAQYRKPFMFDVSDFEEQAYQAAASALSESERAAKGRRPRSGR